MDAHNERSKLVSRHKSEVAEQMKKVKKLKGAMKEAAQKEMEDLEKKQEAEMTSFDAAEGTKGKEKAPPKLESAAVAAANNPDIDINDLRERQWNGLSKKELEECCTERGLSKKGAKEDLVMRCIQFHQELVLKKKEAVVAAAARAVQEADEEEQAAQAKKEKKAAKKEKKEKKKAKDEDEEGEEGEEGEEEEEDEEAAAERAAAKAEKKAKKEKKAARRAAEEEEEDEEEEEVEAPAKKEKGGAARGSAEVEEEEDSDEDEDDGLDVDAEEMERQAKREKAVQTALRFLLTKKCPEGFPLSEFEAKLESIKVTGFDPEKLGYRSIEKFVKLQPPNVLQYDKAKKFVGPPRKKGEEA